MFAQLVTSFIASACFGIIFNAPKSTLLKCGLVGALGWLIYIYIVGEGVDSVPASLAASFFVSMISHVFAKRYKMPVIIFTVGGIIPLVPGGLAYDAMRNFVVNDYNLGVQMAAKVLLIAGAIAMGIVFSEVLNQVNKKIYMRFKRV